MKVMVVEDDAALREIYSIRIAAEGYAVVSAGDGEEALAVAVREKPDLILSDIMMPKISGFDMLDILRSTPETAKIKVIMMTALSGDDQRARGERLGANRYLVKSQVGIEDVVNAIHEELGDRSAAKAASVPAAPQPEPVVRSSVSPNPTSFAAPSVAPEAQSPASATQASVTSSPKSADEIPAVGQAFQAPNVPGSAQ
ncbi:response regulator [Candidatus Saccharibacteria bacterium]|nr:response regulator [Candidatus Saccharibacteria bacterium]